MSESTTRLVIRILGAVSLAASLFCVGINFIGILVADESFSGLDDFYHRARKTAEAQAEGLRLELESDLSGTEDQEEKEYIQEELNLLEQDLQAVRELKPPRSIFQIPILFGSALSDFFLFAGGIGLLLLSPWGRKISLIAVFLEMFFLLCVVLMNTLVDFPALNHAVALLEGGSFSTLGAVPMDQIFHVTIQATKIIVYVIYFFVALYPLALLFLMYQKDIKEMLK